uniref:Succinate dehydrogenase assembly factor 4, mitochondrial n=1 Tax=Oreochromis niloticus TaxID=8128 RepID=A0A669EJ03_ORENI
MLCFFFSLFQRYYWKTQTQESCPHSVRHPGFKKGLTSTNCTSKMTMKLNQKLPKKTVTEDLNDSYFSEFPDDVNPVTKEKGGPRGPEPTRYGDWERKGRCVDF